jgi:hypothetical protein
VRADPPIRRDGRCSVCAKPRKKPATSYGRDEYARDPFCSTKCARKWHGTTLADIAPGPPTGPRTSRGTRYPQSEAA